MKKYTDLLGISAAGLCLIHCLLFPLLMVLPMGISHNAYIDLCFLSIGIWPVYRVIKENPPVYLKVWLIGSLTLIGVSVLLDILFHIHSVLIYMGAAGLITGHFTNFKLHSHEAPLSADCCNTAKAS